MGCRRVLLRSLWSGLTGAFGHGSVYFTGVIAKYDSTFSGIGPNVYFLPPPKTESELLDDRYAEKEVDSALVEEYVERMQYYHRLEMTGNGDVAVKYVPIRESQISSIEGKLLMVADYNVASNNLHAQADIPNRLAMERSEEHTSEIQSLMRNSYAGFHLKKKKRSDKTKTLN